MQWSEIAATCHHKGHIVVLDMAYQGLAGGGFEEDAMGLRALIKVREE